jgi:transposase-like protein
MSKLASDRTVLSTQDKDELRRLRRENKQSRQEREILAKPPSGFPEERNKRRPIGITSRQRPR